MMRLARSAAFLSLGMAAAAAAAPPVREPARKWVLDYGETSCTALHQYGPDKAPLTVAFRPSPDGNVVRFILVRPGTAASTYHFPVTVEMGGRRFETTGLYFTPRGGRKQSLVWINFHRTDLEGLRPAGAITLRGAPLNDTFPLPNIGGVLDGLDKCNDDLRHYWHADAAGRAELSRRATPLKPLPDYFSPSDYPEQAIRESAGGRSRVVLRIDEAGTPKDCLVEETSGIATLDAQTCAILIERAKFAPALDANGKPTRSVLTEQVKWVASF
jgi:TonB family protein